MNVEVGMEIPPWTMEHVDPEKMKLYAAIARDPNPIHWDRAEVAKRGMGDRLINQGPLNLAYIVNMLHAWAGPGCIRSLNVKFTAPVYDGDTVAARGVVTAVRKESGELVAECEVWVEGESATRRVVGLALVAKPTR